MDRDEISLLAHSDHPIAAPVDDESVRHLLRHAVQRGDDRILDLGCGTGEWVLRALETYPGVIAEGVDISGRAVASARQAAAARGISSRLALHVQDAAEFTSARRYDVVLAVGVAHAFGDLLATVEVAGRHLAVGGRIVVGDGFWERSPTAEAVAMLGGFGSLAETLDGVVADGWTPVQGHVSTREELDRYEWAWTGSLASWALRHRDEPASGEVLAAAARHRSEWLNVYRDVFGFVSLVLCRTSP